MIEARNEADTILAALEKGRTSPAWGQLTTIEKDRIADQESNLTRVKSEDDYNAIRKAIDELIQGTMRLAELMMNTAVTTALKGKSMDQDGMAEGINTAHPVAKADFE